MQICLQVRILNEVNVFVITQLCREFYYKIDSVEKCANLATIILIL